MPVSTAGLENLWKRVGAILETDAPLPSRIAEAALAATGARHAALYLRDRDAWVRAGERLAGEPDGSPIPDPLPEGIFVRDGDLWLPLSAEGETHGMLRLLGVDEAPESSNALAFLFGALVGAHRLARQVRDAEFELKARLLELESLYDLGLSLGGQLDLSALADEVLFRSISLTDAGKGTLVLVEPSGAVLLERSVGGDVFAARDVKGWSLPEGGVINNDASGTPTAGLALASCQKCLAVAISVPGRQLGVLAVADKESRDGRVLDFSATDARLLSLFANQAAAAIDTARLHRDAIEKERIERELELAAAIQRQILPRDLPEVPGLEIAAKNVPTRQVGGDYYDLFPLSRGRLGFVVADVSGKGVPAALLVSTVHAAVHLQIDEAPTIADLVGRIDRHLQRYAATRKFLTCFFGVIEPDTGTLRYVSAGHNPALLRRRSGALDQLGATGVPLGMFPKASWKELETRLEPGDLLCVYTDGVTEALDANDQEFGLERLSKIVGAEAPPVQLCREVFAAVDAFAAGVPQYDDQTLLLVRRKE
ncbi:MAG TPA: GAF domain-containing SpoIIE family protein phosphatase [Thermoanaerobaculia bacterium]|nr:GAF domain-containing SpoIIE family protein phosphatase [Thermoanaerobaculia bacterium]